VHQARPDAKHHFEFTDKDEAGGTAKRPSSRQNDSMGLYKDNVTNEGDDGRNDGETYTAKKPLGTMINVDLAHRRKDFGSQFDMADDSPVPAARSTRAGAQGDVPAQPQLQQQRERGEMPPPQRPLQARPKPEQAQSNNQNLARVVKSLDASWQNYDDSPDPVSKKENVPRSQAAADSAKYNNAQHWQNYDDSPDPVSKKENVPRSQSAADSAKYNNTRHWGFGDEDD
jgi:hypothetical protein